MAASGAKSGFGTALTIGGAITEVVDINGPNVNRPPIDVTHMASDNGYREYIAGLSDGGEITFTLNFIKAVATTLLGYFDSSTQQTSSTMVLANSLGTITFTGIYTNYSVRATIDDRVTADVTVKISGKPVLS
jgi:predicted secreted protein